MENINQKLAQEVLLRNGKLYPTRALVGSKETVALRGRGNGDVDDLDNNHIYALASLCAKGAAIARHVAILIEEDEDSAEILLSDLCRAGYAQFDGNEYSETELGGRIIREIAIETLRTEKMMLVKPLEISHKLLDQL